MKESKNIIRIKAVCLFLAVLFMLTSCGIITINKSSETETETTTGDVTTAETKKDYETYPPFDAEKTVLSRLDELEDADLNEQSVFVAVSSEYGGVFDENDKIFSAFVYMRNREIEKKFNVKIVTIPDTQDNIGAGLKAAKKSGDKYTDIAIMNGQGVYDGIASAYLGNLNIFPYFDENAPGIDTASDVFKINNKRYAVCGNATLNPGNICCVYSNDGILDGLNLKPGYSEIINGDFTFERFYNIIKEASVVYSLGEDDKNAALYIGMGGYFTEGRTASVPSNANDIVSNIKTLTDFVAKEEAIPASELKPEDKPEEIPESFDLTDFNLFRYGKSALAIGSLNDITKLGQAGFPFDVLPMPKYDENQDDYRCPVLSSDVFVSVSAFDDNVDAVGRVVNALFHSSDDCLLNTFVNEAKVNYITNIRTLDSIELVYSTAVYDFAVMTKGKKGIFNATLGALNSAVKKSTTFKRYVQNNLDGYNSAVKLLK